MYRFERPAGAPSAGSAIRRRNRMVPGGAARGHGPYYKNAKSAGDRSRKKALESALATEIPDNIRSLVVDLQKHSIAFPETQELIAKLAATDPTFQEVLIDMLSTTKNLEAADIATLCTVTLYNKKAHPHCAPGLLPC